MAEHPSLLVTIFAFLLVLGPLVLVHELGHYLVGRWFGVKADAFSIGFGKEIAGWTDKRGTRWKLSALPLGGYVQFAGDMNAASAPDRAAEALPAAEQAHMFQFKPLWQRALIVGAGPVTNFVVAVAIYACFFFAYGNPVTPPVIAGFADQSTAQAAGLKVGDRILSIDGADIETFDEVRQSILPFPGRTVPFAIQRDGERRVIEVRIASTILRDRFGNEGRVGQIGIAAQGMAFAQVGPIEAVSLAGKQTIGVMRTMVTGLSQIFTGERSVKELGGPIKIAKYSGERLSLGWLPFVDFVAMISINLAFINLLPIPGLDGGHLAFYAAEAVRRRPLGLRSQEWALRTGIAFVLALMVFVTINDISGLALFGG